MFKQITFLTVFLLLTGAALLAQEAKMGDIARQFYQRTYGAAGTAAVGRTQKKFNGKGNGDYFGYSVASAGDVNGDGYGDLIVGAYGNDEVGSDEGKAYLYFGGPAMDLVADVIFSGEAAYDYFGISVASAGDVNGDGYGDVIVGAYYNDANGSNAGKAYIYYGGAAMDNTADVTMTGEAAGDNFGVSVASAGDVNGDDYGDVIVGAYLNDDGGTDAGKAYIYYGGAAMDNTADVSMTGEAPDDDFGISVASAGDVNGDGYADVIVGAYLNDANGYTDAGKAYIYYGDATMDNTADVSMTGVAAFDFFGRSVASAGDVNGDGYKDVIVGAHGNNSSTGKAYIYYGGASMDNTADVSMTGEVAHDRFGISVASAGDVNSDGYGDVIVGADHNDDGGSDAGKAYIYYGGAAMNNSADVSMTGEAAGDYFGYSVAMAGDVNGDGYGDVIVGAYGNDADGNSNAGAAYLYLFKTSGFVNQANWTATGANGGDWFGVSVASAGDVNGDGYGDIIVGAYLNNDGGVDAGKAYIYYGGAAMNNSADVSITGEAASDYFGYSVSSAGDVNGDGYGDVIVGAYWNDDGGVDAGKAYIYYGGVAMDNTADVTMTGEAAYDNFGRSVASAGDVNGDGYGDVIVGAYLNDEVGTNAGKAYIYYGGAYMNNTADVSMTGEAADDRFGYSVASAGDVNGDGYGDVIVCAYYNDDGGPNAGNAYIYYGGAAMNNTADVSMNGEAANDYFGISVASAGDVNGDGYGDVIVGAYGNDDGGTDAGKAYIYYGSAAMNNTADVSMNGEAANDYFGISVASAGDVNGDGYGDVIVGAHGNDDGGTDAGKAYIYFGSATMDNTADVTMSGEVSGDKFGRFVASAVDVNGDGYGDVIVSAPQNDDVGTDAGKAYIYYATGQAVKPHLFYAKDVPQDQGGYVLLKWSKSAKDVRTVSEITQYVVQRSASPQSGWENLAEIPASHQSYYNYTAKTLADSTSSTPASVYYRIVAKTNNLREMWVSNYKSTHSVDNLSPCQTQGLTAQQTAPSAVLLSWDKNSTDSDLSHYEVHHSTVDDFTPESATLITTTTDTSYVDNNPALDVNNYYKIIAVDVHENKATPSALAGLYVDSSLPVALESFHLETDEKGYPLIRFTTASELDLLGFNILRATGKDSAYKVLVSYKQNEALQSKGNRSFGSDYSYVDKTVKDKTIYWYKLQSVDINGHTDVFIAVSIKVELIPQEFALMQNYPNPFNPVTIISYQLPVSCHVKLTVYNARGQKVKELVNKEQPAGTYTVQFEGTGLSSGLYFYRLKAGSFNKTRKALLVR